MYTNTPALSAEPKPCTHKKLLRKKGKGVIIYKRQKAQALYKKKIRAKKGIDLRIGKKVSC
jgi:hypothetical protein